MWNRTLVCVSVLALSACDTNTPSPPAAQITLTASPSTVTPIACPPSSCGAVMGEVEIITTIAMRETAGGSGTLDGFTVALRRTSDHTTILNTTVGIGAGTRIVANQTVNVPFAIHVPQTAAGSPMTLTLVANGRNDGAAAGAVTATLEIPVNAYGG